MFSLNGPLQNMCGPILCPRVKILTYLEEVNYVMLHNKYQGSRLCGFREEDFSGLPYIILYKTCDPGAGPFLTPGSLFEQTW